ncbi:MAG TPA: hypothetical protein VFV11_03705 [Solimonas sp.]|nr:hypothetical protein [Solimonas sp.]
MSARRRNHYDVTDTVCVADPQAVGTAVGKLLRASYPGIDLAPLRDGIRTFSRLYAGTLPGYHGCDTWYHDAQHSLDCTLAMARLIDGHERSVPAAQRLGERRAMLGVLIALFHDAGYIRHDSDDARNGAEFTLTHVRRSGDFLVSYLPRIGFGSEASLARRIVHYTGYEIALDKIQVEHPKDRLLGFLLGSADILAQTSDRCYLEKCRDFLYREFELCGLAGNRPEAVYRSSRELLERTADYNQKLWSERLDGYFGGVHRYLAVHFGGRDPYVEAVRGHMARIARLSRSRRLGELRRKPAAINAQQLRRILGLRTGSRDAAPRRPGPARALRHAA